MGDRGYNLKFGPGAAESVDQYLEYKRIVGEDDGGTLFTPEQYEAYKKKVVPTRMKNRLFVSWTSPTGMDCKMIGPETKCFCQHRYKQHKTDFEKIPTERPIMLPCRVKGCKCVSYNYVPQNSSQPIRCRCKHYSDDHTEDQHHGCRKCTPDEAFLNQAIGASDHPFLRMHAPTLNQLEGRNGQEVAQLTDDMANFKLTGTDADMEYYEKRYQQRLKEERMRARGAPNIKPPARRQALPQTRSGSSSAAKAKTTSSRSGKPSGK